MSASIKIHKKWSEERKIWNIIEADKIHKAGNPTQTCLITRLKQQIWYFNKGIKANKTEWTPCCFLSGPLHPPPCGSRLRRQRRQHGRRQAAPWWRWRDAHAVLVSRLQEAASDRPELHLPAAAEERPAGRALDAARRRAALRLQVIPLFFISPPQKLFLCFSPPDVIHELHFKD